MTWSRVERLFREALERTPAERAAWLDGACAGDPQLRARIEDLLRAHQALEETGDDFLAALDTERAASLLESSQRDLEPGESLGRYRIVRVLGRGGVGVVYQGHDPELDRSVALKVLPARPAASARTGDPLLHEARAASALDHPNIGTVYEVGHTDDGGRFIAMATYDGGTLRDRLRAGPLPPDATLQVARQMAEGLATAHAAGIVHRDLKPENLVFDRRGAVKLVDFGLASGGTGGTPAYMSPEQRTGHEADARADVWAFGVVAYEMLTGRRPDPGDLDRGLVRGLPPDTPPELALVLRRCLELDPLARPASGDAIARELAPEPGTARAAAGGIPWRTPIVAAAAVVLAVMVSFVAIRNDTPRVLDAAGSAAGTFPERGWVVVADFDGADGTEDLSLAAREALAVDLQQSAFVRVASRAQIAGVLRRMGVDPDAPLVLPRAMEVGERMGAGAVLGATISRAGPDFVLSGRGLDPTTGEELFAVRTTAPEDGLLGAVERLSREMRARLGETAEALARSQPLPEVTTESIEALRLYAEAERDLARDGGQAAALLAAALAADSTFAMAHRLAAAAATARLSFGDVALHMTRAYRYRERLPERERWHVEAIYHSNVAFEPRRAAEMYELIVSRYPNDARAWNNLGVMRQAWLDDHEGAFEAFDRAAREDSTLSVSLVNGTYAAYVVGHVARADSLAAMAEAAGVQAFRERWRVARAFAEGDAQAVMDGCERLLALEASTSFGGADDAEVCGSMDVASGRFEVGIPRLVKARDDAVASGRYRNATHAAQALVMADLLRGDTASAPQHVNWVLDHVQAEGFLDPDRFITRINLRVQAALFGMDELEARVAATYPTHPDPQHWFARIGEGLVQAAHQVRAGDGAAALRTLDQASTPGHVAIGWRIWEELLRGLAHEQAGDLAAAAHHLRAATDPGFLTHPFGTKDRIHLPMAREALERVEGVSAGRGAAAGGIAGAPEGGTGAGAERAR